MRNIKYLSSALLIIIVGSPLMSYAEESHDLTLGVGSNYHHNIQGDYYDDAVSLYGIAEYDRIQGHFGIKRFSVNSTDEEKYISDLALYYEIFEDDYWKLNIGLGLEKTSPTIRYLAQYKVTKNISLNGGFNQVLSEDYVENYNEIVLGLSFNFGKPTELEDERIYQVNADVEKESKPHKDIARDGSKQVISHQSPSKDSLPNPYVVSEGDWLIKINQAYKANLEEVIDKNKITNPDLIYPKQKIYFYFD